MISSKSTELLANSEQKQDMSWQDKRYQRFYEIVDHLVSQLQEHVWVKLSKTKRRLAGTDLDRLSYSVECLIRDCVAVILQRERKAEASIKKGQSIMAHIVLIKCLHIIFTSREPSKDL